MSEPLAVTITDVELHDEGVSVECLWRQGDRDPRQWTAYLAVWSESPDEVRAMVSGWVLMSAQEEHKLRLLRGELLGNGWTLDFDLDKDPFDEDGGEPKPPPIPTRSNRANHSPRG